jgi:hypothetical protein
MLAICFILVFSLANSSILKTEGTYPLKRRFAFNGLHGVTSYKTELFITAAVITTNPALPEDMTLHRRGHVSRAQKGRYLNISVLGTGDTYVTSELERARLEANVWYEGACYSRE